MNDTAQEQDQATGDIATSSPLMDPAVEQGMMALLEKLAPLLQGRRFHNLVDLASLASDGVDMFDDAMVQKAMKAYEDVTGGAWTLGNAARHAVAQAADLPVPTLFGLLRVAGDEDVRRGLHMALRFLAVLGQQVKDDTGE